MNPNVAAALIGVGGVAIGAFLAALAANRARVRMQGYAAARLAIVGLEPWRRASELIDKRKGSYPSDDYDVHLALDLTAIRKHLNLDWWEGNHGALVVVASDDDQWSALTKAAQQGRGALMLLESIGDVGKDVLEARSRAARDHDGHDAIDEPCEEAEQHPEQDLGPEVAVFERQADRLQQAADDIAAMGEDLRRKMSALDARLYLVGDVYQGLKSTEPAVREAIKVCRELEKANRGMFGLSRMKSAPRLRR